MIAEAVWIGGALTLAWPLAGLHWLGYRSWQKTTATVVRLDADPSPSAGDGRLVAPVVAFRLPGGAEVEVTEAIRANTPLRVGQKVAVIYPPEQPTQARVAANHYTMHLVVGAIGVVILLIGVFGHA